MENHVALCVRRRNYRICVRRRNFQICVRRRNFQIYVRRPNFDETGHFLHLKKKSKLRNT
jgi:hypothetical protein